jgi:UPF0716 protein FxsA
MYKLFFVFIVVPLVELWLLLTIGKYLGVAITILIIIATGIIGFTLVKITGFSLIMRMREKLAVGEIPSEEMVEGVLVIVAGALLLTPGFITDIVGFLLLIPPTRIMIRKYIVKRLKMRIFTNMKTG